MADENKEVVSLAREVSGPLPSAQEFAGYEKTLPGAADKILKLMEQETAHRHKNEETMIKESLQLSRRGQNCGMIIMFVSAVLLGLSIALKQPLASIAPAILALTSLAAVFIGKKQ